MFSIRALLCASLFLFSSTPFIFGDNVHEQFERFQHFIKSDAEIEKIVEKANIVAQKYSDPKVIDHLINPEKKRQENLQEYGNELLYEFEFPEWMYDNFLCPRIGIYRKDILKTAFASSQWIISYIIFRQFKHYFVNKVTQILLEKKEEILPLLGEKNKDDLYKFIKMETHCSLYQLCNKDISVMFVTYLILKYMCMNVEGRWVCQHDTSNPSFLIKPITSFMEPKNVMNLAFGDNMSRMLTLVNDFLERQRFILPFFKRNSVIFVRDFSFMMLFIHWFIKEELAYSVARNLTLSQAQLKNHLFHYQKNKQQAKEDLSKLVERSSGVSVWSWMHFKNKKITELTTYYNVFLCATGLANVGWKVYSMYRHVKAKAQGNVS